MVRAVEGALLPVCLQEPMLKSAGNRACVRVRIRVNEGAGAGVSLSLSLSHQKQAKFL